MTRYLSMISIEVFLELKRFLFVLLSFNYAFAIMFKAAELVDEEFVLGYDNELTEERERTYQNFGGGDGFFAAFTQVWDLMHKTNKYRMTTKTGLIIYYLYFILI